MSTGICKNKASLLRGLLFLGQFLVVFGQVLSLNMEIINDIINGRMEYSIEYSQKTRRFLRKSL